MLVGAAEASVTLWKPALFLIHSHPNQFLDIASHYVVRTINGRCESAGDDRCAQSTSWRLRCAKRTRQEFALVGNG